MRQIKKAKFNNLEKTEILLTFLDGSSAIHIEDDVAREYSYSYLIFLEKGGLVEPFETDIQKVERISKERYQRLQNIWNQKTLGIKKIAIDKPYMNNPEAVENQYAVYEEMYANAKRGLYSEEINSAIISANEGAKSLLAPLILLLNDIRGVLDTMIENNTPGVDEALDSAEGISLSVDDLTPERLQQIADQFIGGG